jgi:uncharacterized protein YcbX
MLLSNLWVYPLKGAAGIPVDEWALDSFGLMHDRRWMVVDGEGGFITQRSDAVLGQVRPSLEADSLVLQSAIAGECRVSLAPGGGAPVRVRVWSDEVDAVDCGDAAAAFMTRHLGREARIVHMPDDTLRPVRSLDAHAGGRVSFADAFPLLIIGDGSLDELNRRLEEPVEMVRFRPNVVVSGTSPHEEDAWRSIRLGDVECDVVRPCARCVVPTIDPATGIAGREPNRTLAEYRKWDRRVWFGQNAIHCRPGTLVVGATVTILETGEPEPPLLL